MTTGLDRMTKPITGRANTQAGFTLIEIMIVIAIILGILAVGAPRLFSSSTQMRSSVRKIAVMTREIRNNARLMNSTHRLVIDMTDKKSHNFSVESAPGTVSMLTEDMEKELERMTEAQRDGEPPKQQFTPENRIMKKPQNLPKGLYFESVEFASRNDTIESGKAYIHFFPQGLSEEAAIHLTDGKTLNWTIAINPLTGRADVYESKVSLKELRSQ